MNKQSFRIDFNQPCLVGKEFDYMAEAVQNKHISGDGIFSKRCHTYLEQLLGVPKVLLTTSCTHALEMNALLLNIQPGDEVILPSFTFVSTANAFALRGARPVFADIRPDTLNLDETRLEALITPRTRAIMVVHYAGIGCEMDTIMEIARRYQVPVLEDNAHGLFGRYKGRLLGTFGVLSTLSFHETKNITCGEGGALVINDPSLIEQAEILREKGTDRSRFFRGQVDKYSWVSVGSSYLASDLLAAYLFAQLEVSAQIQARRQRIWERYRIGLADWAASCGAHLPVVPAECDPAYHLFYIRMPDLAERQALIAHLRQQSIESVFHYLPLHLSKMGRSYGYQEGDCPVTEQISDQLLRLPYYYALSDEQQDQVIETIRSFKS